MLPLCLLARMLAILCRVIVASVIGPPPSQRRERQGEGPARQHSCAMRQAPRYRRPVRIPSLDDLVSPTGGRLPPQVA